MSTGRGVKSRCGMEEEKVEQRGKKDGKKTKKNIGKREKLLKLHLVTLIVITSKRSILNIEKNWMS